MKSANRLNKVAYGNPSTALAPIYKQQKPNNHATGPSPTLIASVCSFYFPAKLTEILTFLIKETCIAPVYVILSEVTRVAEVVLTKSHHIWENLHEGVHSSAFARCGESVGDESYEARWGILENLSTGYGVASGSSLRVQHVFHHITRG